MTYYVPDTMLQALIATEYYLPLFFQAVMGSSPSYSGVLILPITLTQSTVGIITGIIIHRTGRYNELLLVGVVLLTLGCGLYVNLSPSSSLGEIVSFELIAGIGAGLLFSPPLVALQAMVSQKDTATATGTLGFVRNLATVLAVVIGGIMFQNTIGDEILKVEGLPANITAALSGSSALANIIVIDTIADASQKFAVEQAVAFSLRNIWIMCVCMSACGMVASIFIAKKELSKTHEEAKTGLKN